MHSLLATTVADQDTFGSFLGSLVHHFLPFFALAAGVMVVIWVACAVIAISGYLIGGVIVCGVRALVHACVHHVRRRRDAEDTQLVTVDADGTHTTVVNLDRYRGDQQQRPSDYGQSDDTITEHSSDDDPA